MKHALFWISVQFCKATFYFYANGNSTINMCKNTFSGGVNMTDATATHERCSCISTLMCNLYIYRVNPLIQSVDYIFFGVIQLHFERF